VTSDLSVVRGKRRTNSERSADTRQQVIEAVIAILNRKGFSALTNALIISETGISSGALMHHFPTRQQLLIATVEHAYTTISDYRGQQLSALEPGLPRFRALIDLAWHCSRMPAGLAVNEVRIGARSDAELATTFRPVFTRIANDFGRYVSELARDAGLEPDDEMQGLWTATSMALRSLAIDGKTYGRPQVATNAILALRTLRETLIVRQLGASAGRDPHVAWQPLPARDIARLKAARRS
jgi:AcrR family transcriptional regulator